MNVDETTPAFTDLGLIPPVLEALDAVGYETPSPIQALTIPPMLAGKDVLGQAQTGTGKTAAFALPLLSRLDASVKTPQVMVLTPTRELAIQVAEAFQRYASKMGGFRVVPIYGGQAYEGQLRQLRRGVHVVVGTPGRVMDHMRRGTLALDTIKCLVLDEADEMLRMGFIDDVEWILEKMPTERQIALFSATMPRVIRKIAQKHLRDPEEVILEVKTTTAETIRQRYWTVSGFHKLDALTRLLEAEPFDAMIVFVRTKTATVELEEKLGARGFAAAAINGDMAQQLRERTVDRLRKGKLDILIATDVAARGLDVERISHVINFDIPYDTDSYVHRVGRTGRAGRTGEAILFVSPRERRMLRSIELATRQRIERMEMPSTEVINDKRVIRFKQAITDTLAKEEWRFYYDLLEQYRVEHDVPALEIAAALAKLVQGDEPLLLVPPRHRESRGDGPRGRDGRGRDGHSRPTPPPPESGMERYRLEVGRAHGVQPGNIVGAIANEAELDASNLGRIHIYDGFSTVDLPEGMPLEIFKMLKGVQVCGQALKISRLDREAAAGHQSSNSRDDRRQPHQGDRGRRPGGGPPKKNFRRDGGKPFPGSRRPDSRGPGRPDSRGPGRPDSRGPGRPDSRGPGRPDSRGPGRPDSRGPGRPDSRSPGRPGRPGRPDARSEDGGPGPGGFKPRRPPGEGGPDKPRRRPPSPAGASGEGGAKPRRASERDQSEQGFKPRRKKERWSGAKKKAFGTKKKKK